MENPSKKRALWVGVIVLGLVVFAYFFFQKKEIPSDVKTIKSGDMEFQDILIDQNIVSSKGEARRLVEGGAITELETNKTISFEEIKKVPEKGTYKIGKNRFIKII